MAKVGTNEESVVNNPPSEPKVSFIRRKLIKIPVAVNAISRKPKEKPKQDCQNPEISIEKDRNDQTRDNIIGVSSGSNVKTEDCIEKVPVKDSIEINHNLDETYLTSQNTNSSTHDECVGTEIKKLPVSISSITAHSDTEYPPPPPSPNKINRTRIKAVPRLDYRKASFSASESEDESRKNNRIRNDSVCSTTSAVAESVTECFSPQRPREIPIAAPKKCVRSEQTRKLAEARREFQRKFGPNKPERHKLTMMDLIFYNPDSNHMIRKDDKKAEDNPKEEINVDDPKTEVIDLSDDTSKNEKENDEESAVPVPQIKIGPSGEIIIDEQSLVIERKEVKKQIEEMAKTKLVDGDFDTGYGIYKKHKRSKKWSEYETVRFYKAINIIGTDFSLMSELFPNRTRRELKMKFKKEENLNKGLMNRAVMQPGHFDFDELKNEVDLEEKERQEKLKLKEEEIKQREVDKKLTKQKMARRAEKRKIAEKEKEANFKLNKPPKPKPEPRPPKKIKKSKRARNDSFVEDSDADESDLATHSESDDEIVVPQGPTRSGRMPKSVRKYEDDEDERLATVESVISRTRAPAPAPAPPVDVEPGSIMIVTETGPNGEPVYKIFMVTPDHNAMPLQLSSDFVSKALELKKGVTAKNIMTISASVTDEETETPVVENNITIPADENVTTLKSEFSESEEKYIVGTPGIGSEVEI